MSWDLKLFQRHLTTRRFGREFVWLDDTDSTNRWLIDNQSAFTMSGGVVAADHQTAGRGRFDRRWMDEPGTSLLFSVFLRQAAAAESDGFLTLIPAIALAEVLAAHLGTEHRIKLKWPNDLLLNGKKISGILGQASAQAGHQVFIIGVGLNVATKDFPAELAASATSLERETGRRFQREILMAEILGQWEALHDDVREGRIEKLQKRWEAFGPLRGEVIERQEGQATLRGQFAGLGARGQLLLTDDHGVMVELFTGDIRA
jgi:BirA family biotin operon repressor/biotin-[acetyl-CoA-carboxylase] ligase